MGIEKMNLGPGKFFITNPETGEEMELCPGIGTLEIAGDLPVRQNESEGVLKIPDPGEIVINLEINWSAVKFGMSRKRFVKLLMGRGIPRNVANSLARTWWEKTGGAPYFLNPLSLYNHLGYKTRLGNCRIV